MTFSVPNAIWPAFAWAMHELGCPELSVLKRTPKSTTIDAKDMAMVAKAMKMAAQSVAASQK